MLELTLRCDGKEVRAVQDDFDPKLLHPDQWEDIADFFKGASEQLALFLRVYRPSAELRDKMIAGGRTDLAAFITPEPAYETYIPSAVSAHK